MKTVRNTLFLGTALALAACGGELNDAEMMDGSDISQTEAPLMLAPAGTAIPGSYIVVTKQEGGLRRASLASRIQARHNYSVINGFAADLTAEQLAEVRKDANVLFVEEDAVVKLEVTQSPATWGIDRIDQVSLPLSNSYTYTTTASNVTAYVIDTGIQINHSQFGGRAAVGYDAIGDGQNGNDCQGHGTHVAGTIGSATYGVAKGVKLRAVRVLNCSGSGSNSGVIAGINWVTTNHVKPAVANMSLGGSASSAVNTAVTNLSNAGVFVAVAAGNSNANASGFSPASAPAVTTVGASTKTDARASYSNYGSLIDIFAPGTDITSTWINSGTNTISGTSMASPHVAGVGALYKGTYGDASSATVDSWIKTNASIGKITGAPSGTTTNLLNKKAL
ncbi:Serine protease, subtilisin family [Stigmatella aurantiaca]|uniref:Serine protease, subtilisin family n=1 Tax=Stigmatella aurantiaca TaxID=41 RepID=A0A1H8B9Y9_STIAU|nr:S8 family peptidase [Stigmatella aurantiaca]SEM79239.1 Serine protease, subtilisin family [Stigmatella aurantiaca]